MAKTQKNSKIFLFKLEKLLKSLGGVECVNVFLHRVESQEIKKVSRSILSSYINRNFERMTSDVLFIEGLAKFIHFSELEKSCINLRLKIQARGSSAKTLESTFSDLLLLLENLSDSIRLFLSKVSNKTHSIQEKSEKLFNYSNTSNHSHHSSLEIEEFYKF